MDSLELYRQIICNILTEHTRVPYSYGEIDFELVFDKENDRYLLMLVGREENGKRVHGCLIHIDIIDGKLWIQLGRHGNRSSQSTRLRRYSKRTYCFRLSLT